MKYYNNMANFQKIRELCEEKKMTIRELAEAIGLKENSLHVLMTSGTTNTSTLEKIAQVLNVPAGIFFNNTATNSGDGYQNVNFNSGRQLNSGNMIFSQSPKEVELLRQIELLQQQLGDKNEIISLLKQQLKSKK